MAGKKKKFRTAGRDEDKTPLEYTHERFPITRGLDVHTYMDPNFTPRDVGNFGDIEYMQAQYDTLPYYNDYQKPDSLLGKSVVVYNDRLGEGTNESVALDILSHGLREQDDTWRTKYLPTLMQAYDKDAEYFANKENASNKEEFKDSFIDGKLRAMLVDDKMRDLLNYQSKKEFLDEYRHSTPEQQNALTEAYSYIFPTQLPEVLIVAKKHSEGGAVDSSRDWNALPMKARALLIRDAVSRGVSSLDDIRNEYNTFGGGGQKAVKKADSNALKLTFLGLLDLSLKNNSRYNTAGWRKYLTDLALMESSYRPNITNSIGAKGYFQLMPSNRSSSWNDPTQQFHEMYKLSDANMKYFRDNMTERDLKLAQLYGIDIYGLMAGAHLGGAKSALAALRGGPNKKDMNGSSIMGYMTKFSQTTPRGGVSKDFNTQSFILPPEDSDALTMATPQEQEQYDRTLDITNLPLPIEGGDNSLAYQVNNGPDVVVTPERPLYIRYTPNQIFDLMNSMVTPYLPVEWPKPVTATERLKQLNDDRVSLLLRDLEDSIIRGYKFNNIDLDRLRKDVEDLRFYRNMAAYGGDVGDGNLLGTPVEKPSTTIVARPPYIPTLVEISPEASIRRSNRVFSNYDEAADNPLSTGLTLLRNTLRWIKDNVSDSVPAGVSNCTLTASQWIDPTNPIKNASSIVSDPTRYNYQPIGAGLARVGDMVITKDPNGESYHTMLITGYSDADGVYDFDGTPIKYRKNEPLVTYSRGGNDESFIRRDIPLSVYLLNSDGKTELHFYRYAKPDRVSKAILRKVNKKALGGNLFDGTSFIKTGNRL